MENNFVCFGLALAFGSEIFAGKNVAKLFSMIEVSLSCFDGWKSTFVPLKSHSINLAINRIDYIVVNGNTTELQQLILFGVGGKCFAF